MGCRFQCPCADSFANKILVIYSKISTMLTKGSKFLCLPYFVMDFGILGDDKVVLRVMSDMIQVHRTNNQGGVE
jgi:hypothetical protein